MYSMYILLNLYESNLTQAFSFTFIESQIIANRGVEKTNFIRIRLSQINDLT